MIIDIKDKSEAKRIEKLGIKTTILDTVMKNEADSINLAQKILKT